MQNETEATNASPLLNNRPIHLLELKASGRFGDVWQGKLHSQDVAVKIFRIQEKESWNTEVDIYKVEFGENLNYGFSAENFNEYLIL